MASYTNPGLQKNAGKNKCTFPNPENASKVGIDVEYSQTRALVMEMFESCKTCLLRRKGIRGRR